MSKRDYERVVVQTTTRTSVSLDDLAGPDYEDADGNPLSPEQKLKKVIRDCESDPDAFSALCNNNVTATVRTVSAVLE